MKQIALALIILGFLAGCKHSPNSKDYVWPAADISDVNISEELQKVYSDRRQMLAAAIGTGVVVVRSEGNREGGRHEFRAANSFYYLTGLNHYGYTAVLQGYGPGSFSLYRREKGIYDAIYTGAGQQKVDVASTYGADTLLSFQDLVVELEDIIRSGRPVFIDFEDPILKDSLGNMIARLGAPDTLLRDVSGVIGEMRVHKDELEIARIRKAVDITGEAFLNACYICMPGMHEFEIEAVIEYTFRKNGSSMPAFQSIVGSGPNAVTLHYTENVRKMQDGDLLLMDIGAEYGHYCADITRTVPVNGKFTQEQKDIYELVLMGQKAAIAVMVTGNNLMEGHNRCTEVIARGLFGMGLLTDTASMWQKRFYTLYPISHFLGMVCMMWEIWVHRTRSSGSIWHLIRCWAGGSNRVWCSPSNPDSVSEAGVWISCMSWRRKRLHRKKSGCSSNKSHLPIKKYENIGVRIEDDVLITEKGNQVLSEGIPKEPGDIEELMVR